MAQRITDKQASTFQESLYAKSYAEVEAIYEKELAAGNDAYAAIADKTLRGRRICGDLNGVG